MIYLLMGRGIEGCGVTKFSIEFSKYLTKNNIQHKTLAFVDKNWTRKKSHDNSNITEYHLENDAEYMKVFNELEKEASTIIINSLPSVSHTELFITRFDSFLCLKKKFILFQHDHKRMSIQRNACLDKATQVSKHVFVHSDKNYFAKYIEQKYNSSSLESFFSDEESSNVSVKTFQPAFDFDECRSLYWKDIKDQDPKHHKWIGRTAFWKGFELMFDWHNSILKNMKCVTTFEGIETSIVYPEFIKKSPHVNFCKPFTESTQQIFTKAGMSIDKYKFNGTVKIEDYDVTKHYGDYALVFGIYKNENMLERMSRCGFGYQLSLLNPEDLQRSIEYTHCEVIATGTIPVFHKKYGELAHHRVTGDPLVKSKNSGTIWLDDSNFAESSKIVYQLENDDVLRDEWREMAFEFYKEHQDSKNVFKNIMEIIND